MTKQTIGVGAVADDGTGDPARTAFTKVNANFGEIYGVTGLIKSNGSDTLSAASAGTDYLVPQMAANTLKGNNTGATATAADLTADQAQALLGLLSSTTVGYVPFFTGTVGQMGQDGSLFWDNTNKRLGIGTTGPSAKLEVSNANSGATFEALRLSNSGTGGNTQTKIMFRAAATEYGSIASGYGVSAPEMSFNLPSGGGGNFLWTTAGTERMRVTNAGFVGIGTTTPASKLHIENSANSVVNPQLVISGLIGAVNAGHSIDFRHTSPNSYARVAGVTNSIGTTGELSLWTSSGLTTAATEKVRIDGSGNVGIGTTSPATSFDVNGPIKAKSYTVATLPSAATVGAGTHSYVTDAMTSWTLAAGGTVAGGGANFSRVVSDGSNWKQM